jgi:hypothetical protein
MPSRLPTRDLQIRLPDLQMDIAMPPNVRRADLGDRGLEIEGRFMYP